MTEIWVRNLVDARDPIWRNTEHTIVKLDVLFDELREDGYIPFSCSANDGTYATDIWNRTIAGEFGDIAEYVPPPPQPYTLQMSDFWQRFADDDEYDAFEAALAVALPAKDRRAFNAATSLRSDSALFGWAKAVLLDVVGQSRTDTIMAESIPYDRSSTTEVA